MAEDSDDTPTEPDDTQRTLESTGLWVYSGINEKGEPFVHVEQTVGNQRIGGQLSVAEARKQGQAFFECAEAAETDAMVIRFFTTRVQLDLPRAAGVLNDFRRLREEMGGVKAPNRNDPHWKEILKKHKERGAQRQE